MIHRESAAFLLCIALLAPGLVLASRPSQAAQEESKQKSTKPHSVIISPSGATFHPGDGPIQFSAEALDSKGNVLTGFTPTWSSSKSSVASVDTNGLVTPASVGTVKISADLGGRVGKIDISVLPAPGSGENVVVNSLTQTNHVMVDDTSIYWTEVYGTLTSVRKIAKTGGPIVDIASEPQNTSKGVGVAYVHLQQNEDTVFYSRQTTGFQGHWSIYSVPKAGGVPTQILPEDASIVPMYLNAWLLVGRHIVVLLSNPQVLSLPTNTRVASYDLDAKTWTALITGNTYTVRDLYLLATDGQNVFLRGENNNTGNTDILSVSPAGGTPTTLFTNYLLDADISRQGCCDGQNIYFFVNFTGTQTLKSMPVTGGTPKTIGTPGFGQGLAVSNGYIYWAKSNHEAVKIPTIGGATTSIRKNLYATSALDGLAVDSSGVYIITTGSGNLTLVQDPS